MHNKVNDVHKITKNAYGKYMYSTEVCLSSLYPTFNTKNIFHKAAGEIHLTQNFQILTAK
jgi:hypothetical protein